MRRSLTSIALAILMLAGCTETIEVPPTATTDSLSQFFWSSGNYRFMSDANGETSDHVIISSDTGVVDHILSLTKAIKLLVSKTRDSIALQITDSGSIFRMPPGAYFSRVDSLTYERVPFTVTALTSGRTGVIYAGTDSGGMYFSLNDGLSWEIASETVPVRDITVIAEDPNSSNEFFVGTGSGELWRVSFITKQITSLRRGKGRVNGVSFLNGEVFAAFGNDGVFHSPLNGISWNQIPFQPPVSPQALEIVGGQMWVGTDSGLFQLADSGGLRFTPEPIVLGGVQRDANVTHLKNSSLTVYVVANNQIHHSSDSGSSWTRDMSIGYGAATVTTLDYSPANNELIVGTTNGIFSSTRFPEWVGTVIHALALSSRSGVVLAAVGETLQRDDGSSIPTSGRTWLPVGNSVATQLLLKTPSTFTLLKLTHGTLKLGDAWFAGFLALPNPLTQESRYQMTARVTDHLDLLELDETTKLEDVYAVRYAYETVTGEPDDQIPYWLIHYASGVGPVIIDELKAGTRLSRAIYNP